MPSATSHGYGGTLPLLDKTSEKEPAEDIQSLISYPQCCGPQVPAFIYGTAWKGDKTADFVFKAIKHGFRALDTGAQPKHYDEEGVGVGVTRAIAEGLTKRKDLFIQTKFTPVHQQGSDGPPVPYDKDAPIKDQVYQSVQNSLRNFKVEENQKPYLDCVLLHSQYDTFDKTMEAWKALEAFVPETIRHLGVSGTPLNSLERLWMSALVKPTIVQNRFYLGTAYDMDIRQWCKAKAVIYEAFWALTANKELSRCQIVFDLAIKADVSRVTAYYALVIGLQGVSILNGTKCEFHMKEDIEEMKRMKSWSQGPGSFEWGEYLSDFKEMIRER